MWLAVVDNNLFETFLRPANSIPEVVNESAMMRVSLRGRSGSAVLWRMSMRLGL